MTNFVENVLSAAEDAAAIATQMKAQRDELQRRLTEILDLIDGREDIDSNGGPNLCMKISMTARGEDRP